jgi:hypothetical protein
LWRPGRRDRAKIAGTADLSVGEAGYGVVSPTAYRVQSLPRLVVLKILPFESSRYPYFELVNPKNNGGPTVFE